MRGAWVTVCVACTLACGPDGPTPRDTRELPVLGLSGAPTLEIGVVDGADEYTFGSIVSVLPLPDGTLAVSDAVTGRISIYRKSDGTHVRSFGGEGQGPGEFGTLSRIYRVGDSIAAYDAADGRMSWFAADGGFGRRGTPTSLTADTTFTLDVWLHGRFWVDGALSPERRAGARAVLDALAAPRVGPGYRFVKVMDSGRLWVREPASGGRYRWTVLGPDGTAEAMVDTPTSFEVHHATEGGVVGRWSGPSDVHFARAFDLAPTGETAPLPAWMTTGPPDPTATSPDSAAFHAAIVASVRALASAQEIHYATALSYTPDVEDLGDAWEAPDDIVVDLVHGGPRGWAGVFSHPRLAYVCGLGYGFTTPPGWTPGMVLCGAPAGGS